MKKLLALMTALVLLACLTALPALAEAAAPGPEPQSSQDAALPAEPESAPTPASSWFEQATEKLLELKWYTIAIIAALIVLTATLFIAGRRSANASNARMLAFAAMCIAISFVLSSIHLFRLPQGGTITPISMLPLIAFSVAFGPVQGMLAGCAYGLLQLIQDPFVIHPLQLLVDYPLAFGFLALGGLVRYIPVKSRWKLPLAVILGAFGRYAMAVLSGTVFFAEYALASGQGPLLYSLGYNISYLGPDALLCLAFAFIPGIARIVNTMGGKKII